MSIKTFVFFDLETTGLPKAERNNVKITELCFVAVCRYDIVDTKYGFIPPHHKLSLLFDPEKDVNPMATKITGLSRYYLRNCSKFADKIDTILAFLEELEEPVCLVAHSGYTFDFKVLLTEFNNAKRSLPSKLRCVDSLVGFRRFLKDNPIDHRSFKVNNDILTDDEEEEYPALNISNDEWSEIDKLSTSLSDMNLRQTKVKRSKFPQKGEFTLSAIYKRLLNKEAINAHRAEGDCIMLLECVITLKDQFLYWADGSSKRINYIKPLVPY